MRSLVVLFSLVIAVPTAHAEDKKLADLASTIGEWASRVRNDRIEDGVTAEPCFRAIADAKAAGVAGTQKIENMTFNNHPRVTGDLATGYWITVDDAAYYCEGYKNRAAFLPNWKGPSDAARQKSVYDDGVVAPDDKSMTYVAACHAAVDAANKAGISDDYVVELGGQQMPWGRVRADVCDGLAASIENAKRAGGALREKYEKHGAKGERLELLVAYDSVYWTLPGGKRTDDPATLAKAKVLFQLLEADDPDDGRFVIHTIRKYTFKGHAAKRTEKKLRSARGTRPPAKAFR